jgi:two-component system CheB/CheR fusion protein
MADAGKNGQPNARAAAAPELTPEYLTTLVHEIRNPLAPIRNAAELLRTLCVDERQLQAVDIIERQVVNLTHTLDDVLEAASSRRSLFSLMRQSVDFGDIVEPALRAVRPLIDQQRQSLLVSLPEQHVYMNCDPLRLSQVLQTLLDNATRHTPTGGAIALNVVAGDGELAIEVSDNGAGISTERLPALFNVFAQSTQPRAVAAQESGYSLAISRNIVEMHGGTITAESAGVGRGSRFMVRLPLQASLEQHPRIRGQSNATPRRILVIDDHADSAQSLAQVLACAGHSVVTATSGELGLALAEQFKPEAVVIDIGLPGIDGFDVAIQLRAHPLTKRALLIAVSGFSLKQFRDIDSYSVFRHYLLKPTSPQTLMYIIEHTLEEADRA